MKKLLSEVLKSGTLRAVVKTTGVCALGLFSGATAATMVENTRKINSEKSRDLDNDIKPEGPYSQYK